MSASALALLGYVAWTLALISVNEVLRTILVLSGKKAANSFHPDGADVSPFAHRLARAHANCIENFPIIGGLLLLALVTGQHAVTDPLAPWVLAARIAQSCTHLLSTSSMAVFVRFAFYAVQLAIAAWWVFLFLAG
jgi:uncharacterized MAPEG superfamily protein